ncbi:MAG: hypothetical protein ACQES5_04980 [Thermodesulfobacteriota bacterium]
MINMSLLLNSDSHLAVLCGTQARGSQFVDCISQSRGQVGMISDRLVPFLSNIDLTENVTLPLLYHKNISQAAAVENLFSFFEALDMLDYMYKRKEDLSRKQLLCGYLIRTIASGNRFVYLDWPRLWEVDFLLDCLSKMDSRIQLWVPVEKLDVQEYKRRGFEFRDISRD